MLSNADRQDGPEIISISGPFSDSVANQDYCDPQFCCSSTTNVALPIAAIVWASA